MCKTPGKFDKQLRWDQKSYCRKDTYKYRKAFVVHSASAAAEVCGGQGNGNRKTLDDEAGAY